MPEKTAPAKKPATTTGKPAEPRKRAILDKANNAVTDRDEKQAAEEAKQKAEAEARAKAVRENQERVAAAAKARAEAQERMEEIREKMEVRKAEMAAAAAAAAAPRTYVVKSGDSLSKIAKEQLGDANRWPEIFELNRDQIQNANLIYPGQELRMPK